MELRKLVVIAGICLACAIVVPFSGAVWLWAKAGQFRDVLPGGDYRCRKIPDIYGGEDIIVDKGVRAFVTSDDRRAALMGRTPRGRIIRVDLGTETVVTDVTPRSTPGDFHPQGLALFTDPSGSQTLFVVNRAEGVASVLIFSVTREGQLAYQDTISDPSMFNPNDLVAVGARQFYVTNASKKRSFLGSFMEFSGLSATGTVLFFDGKDFSVKAKGLAFANGINLSMDGTRLYVAEFLAARMTTFARDPATNVLKRGRRTKLSSAPDNIDVAADDTVWIAGHPHVLDLIHYYSHADGIAPSEVMKLTPDGDKFKVESIWSDDSRNLAASSVAAVIGKAREGYNILIGSVADDHILACKHKWDE